MLSHCEQKQVRGSGTGIPCTPPTAYDSVVPPGAATVLCHFAQGLGQLLNRQYMAEGNIMQEVAGCRGEPIRLLGLMPSNAFSRQAPGLTFSNQT